MAPLAAVDSRLLLAIVLLITAWLVTLLVALRLRRHLRALVSSRQSLATRHGQAVEQFVPFMAQWPWDPQRFRFLGNPVDGIQFTDAGIVFVEIKTGNGRLNAVQKQVRDHVQAGRVAWQEVRVR